MVSAAKPIPETLAWEKGKDDGRRWADTAPQAELEHLQRLFQVRTADPVCHWGWYFFDRQGPQPRSRRCDQLAIDILNLSTDALDAEEIRSEIEAFWTEAAGQYAGNANLDNPSYLMGFAEGALEVWNEQRNRL